MTYYLSPYQEKIMAVYIDMYGLDQAMAALARFERHGSLGKAMIETKKRKARK